MPEHEIYKSRDIKKIDDCSILKDLTKEDLKNTIFLNLDAKERKFENCDFSFSRFENGYFRNAQFFNCKFIGTSFVECNFRNSKFELCKFDYIKIIRTHIDVVEVLRNMPSYPNVRRDYLREHRVNAESVGDGISARKYIMEELSAERQHWSNAIDRKSEYYAQHYSGFLNQTKAWWKQIWLWLDWNIWGHGEAPTKLIFTSLIFILVVSGWCFSNLFNLEMNSGEAINLFKQTLVEVLNSFLGLSSETHYLTTIQNVIVRLGHIVFLGLVINLLYRKISRR